jgi:hypothetical protein
VPVNSQIFPLLGCGLLASAPLSRREKERKVTIMLALKFLLMNLIVGFFGSAAILVAYDVYVAAQLRSLLNQAARSSGTAVHYRRLLRRVPLQNLR